MAPEHLEPEHLEPGRLDQAVTKRFRRALVRARVRQRRRDATTAGRLGTLAVLVVCGLLVTVAAVNANGADLRRDRNSDVADLVREQAAKNSALASQVAQQRASVDALSTVAAANPSLAAQLDAASLIAGTIAVKGPAVRVSLNDAPLSVAPAGVDPDLLVVHQQDIQMVVNIMWAAGAEAMTIQGQRVISTTGVKCVGNSVVLHGVPYGPPYVITAIGDQGRLTAALTASQEVQNYQSYVKAYQLGWQLQTVPDVTMPAYQGVLPTAASVAPTP